MSSMAEIGEDRVKGRRLVDALPILATLAAVALFSFLSGGYIFVRAAPIAIVYLLLAAAWVWVLRRRVPASKLLFTALAVLTASTAWTGLSTLWSFGPDLSWRAFDLAAFYLVVFAIVGLTPVSAPQLRLAGWGFLAVALFVGVYAFLGKGLPDVVKHAYTYARLDSPIGYWNVLALLMVMGVVVAVSMGGDRTSGPVVRTIAAASAVPMAFTFFFTFSRGGWVVLVVALIVYFAFTTSRLASLMTLTAVVAPVTAVLWRLHGADTLFASTTDAALRTAQGHALLRWAIVAVAVAAGVQLFAAIVQRAVPWPRWSRLVAGATVLAVLAVLVAGGSWRFLESHGGAEWVRDRVRMALDDADTRSTTNQAGRLASLNTGRPPLWREALAQSRASFRPAGTGAGTFPFTHNRFRQGGGVVRHAHSQWFNALSELGVVGLALLAAALVLVLAACIRNPFTGRHDPLRPLVVALQAGVVAFVLHLSWDWTWDMAAIGTTAFLFAGLTASYLTTPAPAAGEGAAGRAGSAAAAGPAPEQAATRPVQRRLRAWPARVAASLALLLLALSWTLPYLSARAQADAVRASGQERPREALAAARRAARYDPLAAAPLIMEARMLQQLGRDREALRTLRAAQRLQPDDYEAYYQEGLLQLKAFGRRPAALRAFAQALSLNPQDWDVQREIEELTGH